jgi:WD40 repeat protein/serine/threonine protein kinase/tetratricopeptide (TPR) repeat protein
MSVCDAHEGAWGCRKELSAGKGFLLAAQFMQDSPIQEQLIDKTCALYTKMGMTLSRKQCKAQIESTQGSGPWIICEECVNYLKLSDTDKEAARTAAKKWWQDKNTSGHMPGQKRQVIKKSERADEEKGQKGFIEELGEQKKISSNLRDELSTHSPEKQEIPLQKDALAKEPEAVQGTKSEEIASELPEQDGDTVKLKKVPGKDRIIDGRYKILRRIDMGDLFKTYKAQDLQDGVIVVVKYIPASVANDKEVIDKLRSKAGDVSTLSHPNIAKLYKVQLDGTEKYVATEYVDGSNLEDRIFDLGLMSIAETIRVFSQVAEGLDYAHSQNILHGDIKPANIILTKDGKVKLIDFGIGHLIKETLIQKGKLSTTSSYLIPEQLREGKYDQRSEIYSFAATIYECVCGHPPFWGSSIEQQVLNEDPKVLEELSDRQNKTLLKALSKQPETRQSSAKELLDDIQPEASETAEPQRIISVPKEHIEPKHEEPKIESKPKIKVKPEVKSKIAVVIAIISLICAIGIFSLQHWINMKKANICADVFRKNFWRKAQLNPASCARVLNLIQQSKKISNPGVENYMLKLRMRSDVFLQVPDMTWSDFAYRHGRIPVVGKQAKCVLTVDMEEKVLDSKQYSASGSSFLPTTTVRRKQVKATISVRDAREVICSQSFVDKDPPLPNRITIRTRNGIPMGYEGYHTTEKSVLRQAKKFQMPSIKGPGSIFLERSAFPKAEEAFTSGCCYLVIGKSSLGCKNLRYVIDEFPKSEFAKEASEILNPFGKQASQAQTSEKAPKYEDTLPDADKTWENIKQLAEEQKYESAIYKAELFINAFPNNIYAGEIREHLLLWKGIVLKPKIEELLTKANSSKSKGNFDQALEHVFAIFKLDPDCSEAKALQAEIESLKEAQRIAAEKEKHFSDLKNKAFSFETERNWESAIKTYQEALAIKEGDKEVKDKLSTCWHNLYVARAKSAESQGDLNTAIDLYSKALTQKQVDSTQAQLELVKRNLQAMLEKQRREKELAKLLKSAQNSENEGNIEESLNFYEKAQEYSDVSFKEKIDLLKGKLTERKKLSEFNVLLEKVKATSNRSPDEALRLIEKALDLYPDNVEALKLKNQIIEKRKQGESNELYNTAQKTPPMLDKTKFPQVENRNVLKQMKQPVLQLPTNLYERLTLRGHNGWVTSAAFSPDGNRIVSGSYDLTVKIWDAQSGNCLRTLEGHGQLVLAVDFSPDGKLIASGDGWNHTLKIWDASTGACLHTIKAHSGDIHDLSFSPDGRFVASAGDDKLVKIWNVSTGACIKTLRGHSNGVFCIAFSPDGKHIASGSWDKKVKIWESTSGECIQTLKGHGGTVEDISFSRDGSKIASCGYWDRKIIIWDTSNGNILRTMTGDPLGFHAISFSADGNYIVSGNANGKIQIWNVKTGGCLKIIKAHGGLPSLIKSVKFSPDGSHILSAGNDNLIKVWSVR